MKETILKTLLNRVNTNNEIGWKVIDADNVNLDNLANELLEAINYTHCCKSDSEQLVLFADWLQYNGKWSLPEQQAKDFLKEQQEQN